MHEDELLFTGAFTAYLIVIVITCYFHTPEGSPTPGDISLVHFTPNFVSTFPVQVFAFTCAQNVSTATWFESKRHNSSLLVIPNLQ